MPLFRVDTTSVLLVLAYGMTNGWTHLTGLRLAAVCGGLLVSGCPATEPAETTTVDVVGTTDTTTVDGSTAPDVESDTQIDTTVDTECVSTC